MTATDSRCIIYEDIGRNTDVVIGREYPSVIVRTLSPKGDSAIAMTELTKLSKYGVSKPIFMPQMPCVMPRGKTDNQSMTLKKNLWSARRHNASRFADTSSHETQYLSK